MTNFVKYFSRLRINRIIHRLRTRFFKPVILLETQSPISGNIRVSDLGAERSLTIDGATHSYITTGINFGELNREYWGRMSRIPYSLTPEPDILLLGLGGGSSLALIQKRLKPKSITVIERDPIIIEIAKKYFFVDNISNIEIRNISASKIFELFGNENRIFDIIIDDVYNNENQINFIDQLKLIRKFKNLLTPKGIIILNRAIDNLADIEKINKLVSNIRTLDMDVVVKNIRQRWWNAIIYCHPASKRILEDIK
ncbi:MAG: class I SAM-dependent methyltransferase [Ignavibacteriales bacterium]|nr:class I SAM-dependent methyltransferase [Ignavibacteriales bacterium]